MESNLTNCRVCPHACGADRTKNVGVCGAGESAEVARVMSHFFEEPFISGKKGSGAVFFAHCPLKCVYCQNYKISRAGSNTYKAYTAQELCGAFLELQSSGAHNINLVSPTHYTYQLIEAVALAKKSGLNIPVIWNTSGYETVETIAALKGTVDIFLTDFKYRDDALAFKYSGIKNYFGIADAALAQMLKTAGKPRFDKNKMMRSGVVVRHLLLPENVADSKRVLKYLYSTYGDDIYISIMSQFTPTAGLDALEFPSLNRTVTKKEYGGLIDFAVDLGIKKALIQEGDAASESFIPDF